MAESFEEKTEAPTPRRREEAREQGQVARSPDLTAAVLLLAFLLMTSAFGSHLMQAMRGLTTHMLSAESLGDIRPAGIGQTLLRAFTVAGGALAPLFVGIIVIAVAMNLVQVGFFLSAKRLQPNFSMFNPLTGLGRLFERGNLIHLGVNVLKMALVGAVAWSAIRGRLQEILGVQQLSYIQAFGLGASIIYSIGLRVAIVLLILAILDYGYQRYQHEQRLRMTKEEVKEEMRHMEGDPKLKQRRRQIGMQIATRQLRKDVPTADVVVTNPTHFAVALKYDSAVMSAPKLVAKGQDLMAFRIRQIAVEHGVPIVERPPLARAMYNSVKVGQEIPEQFYAAVAEILAYVYEISGKAAAV